MKTEEFEPQRLADAVNKRMDELDLTNDTAAMVGGPSTTTLSKIRNARPGEPRGDVYRKLDTMLRWRPGSAKRLARTGQPPSELPAGIELEELLEDLDRSDLKPDVKETLRKLLKESAPMHLGREARGA